MGVFVPLFLQKIFLIGQLLSVKFIVDMRLLVKVLYQNSHFLGLLIDIFLLFVFIFLYIYFFFYILFFVCVGWSGGAKVLGKLPVPGRPAILITVGQGPIALAVGAGGVVWTFLLASVLSPIPPSL